MKTTRPELGFERLLVALECDLLDATDAEILSVAKELGMKPGMKGSIALLGVTFGARRNEQTANPTRPARKAPSRAAATRTRRRTKGDVPPST